jgi:hypothetical protein
VEWVFSPLDRQLALTAARWSEQVAKLAVWLSGLVTFEQAAEILRRIGQVSISESSVWRQAQEWGEEFAAIEAAERVLANALPGRRDMLRRENQSQGRMGAAMDGSMIHIRDEGWKELKIGCVFEVERRPARDAETGDWEDLAHAVNNSYRAHLGGPELFGQLVWAEARRRNWERAIDTQVVGDGAAWIWNLTNDHFYDSHQVVDWFHATEHLAEAARLLKGEGTLAAKQWYNARKTTLFQGHAARIAQELSAAAEQLPNVAAELQTQAGYFRNHQRRMNYQELREEGWLIGSGMVESGAKQFKARFTGPGMRWSRSGAQKLLPVRAAIMSRRFDSFWLRAYNSPPS